MKRTINIIGDSHTSALGLRLKQLLANDDVWFDAYPGFSTSRVLTALEAQEDTGTTLRPADLTIVILGGNDFGDRSHERDNLLDYFAANHAGTIVWVGPAHSTLVDVDARHRAQANSQQQQFTVSNHNIAWVDSYDATQSGHGPDGVHFTPAGYTTWATWIADVVHEPSSFWPVVVWTTILGAVGAILYKTLRLGKK